MCLENKLYTTVKSTSYFSPKERARPQKLTALITTVNKLLPWINKGLLYYGIEYSYNTTSEGRLTTVIRVTQHYLPIAGL